MGGLALKNGGADIPTMMAALFGTLMVASIQERLETGQNPYFLKCGNILVKMSYAATERTIEDALKTILSAM